MIGRRYQDEWLDAESLMDLFPGWKIPISGKTSQKWDTLS